MSESSLWNAPVEDWLEWEDKYLDALKARSDDLPSFNKKLQKVKVHLTDKKKCYITTAQLKTIMKFKLRRGKFRPGLQAMIETNPNNTTKRATREAFEHLGYERPNLETVKQTIHLTTKDLKGVGPATASLILSCRNQWIPFMADEAYYAAGLGKPNYTLKEYLKFVEKMWEKSDQLSHERLVPNRMVDLLWAETFMQNPKKLVKKRKRKEKSKKPKKKRKLD